MIHCASSLVLACVTSLLARPDVQAQALVAPPSIVQRIAVIGSSVSDGFGLDDDVGAKTTLADIVDATLKTEHDPARGLANALFFFTPETSGLQMVAGAKAQQPTLVVALDYLFWFGYGDLPGELERLALLEKGLKSLEAFQCPILVGDFPDMSLAIDAPGKTGAMIQKSQVPSAETLVKLNERVRSWAARDRQRIVVPVSELMHKLRADEELAVRRNTWFKGSMRFLLQKDQLHTTLEGSIALWLFALDTLARTRPELTDTALEWDAKAVWRTVYASKESVRQAQKEKKLDELRRQHPPVPEPPPPTEKHRDGG